MTKQNTTERNMQLHVKRMVFSALCLALALVLPFLTGQIPEIGSMLCPMHIPTLLCGFICGWPWGLAVGFIAPLLRSVVFGMPKLFPAAVAMAFEMAVYGAVAGALMRRLPRFRGRTVAALVTAMVLGRVAWGIVRFLLAGLAQSTFSWQMFVSGAVLTAVPGILLQLVLIPTLVTLMDRAGLNLNP